MRQATQLFVRVVLTVLRQAINQWYILVSQTAQIVSYMHRTGTLALIVYMSRFIPSVLWAAGCHQ